MEPPKYTLVDLAKSRVAQDKLMEEHKISCLKTVAITEIQSALSEHLSPTANKLITAMWKKENEHGTQKYDELEVLFEHHDEILKVVYPNYPPNPEPEDASNTEPTPAQ